MRNPSATAQRFSRGSLDVEAMRRDGSLVQDLNIAEWMSRSTPHGEYRGNSAGFAVVTATGVLPVRISDWIVRGKDGRFYTCSGHGEPDDPARDETDGPVLSEPDIVGSRVSTPRPARPGAQTGTCALASRSVPSSTIAACSGCDASASELAGRTMLGLTQDLVLSEAGLHRRPAGDLFCEDCWRSLMQQP